MSGSSAHEGLEQYQYRLTVPAELNKKRKKRKQQSFQEKLRASLIQK